jgi:hypothetical protein
MGTKSIGDQLPLDGLDRGILPVVQVLANNGVETFESCEGGEGHAFFEPTVRFHGNHAEGFRAKSEGRDRVVVASASAPTTEPEVISI